ncbi:MAG TPA: hypothetical protein PKC40_06980 [Saprospiraceae bacterium]|nr:hypothetical protein [Saprospiraceae bacterium]
MKTSLLLTAFFIASSLAPYYSFAGKNTVLCDTVGPTAVCINGISATLIGNFPLEIWAADIDAASFGCPPLTFQLNRITDINGDGQVDSGDYLTTPPNQDSIHINPPPYSTTTIPVQLWVIDSIGRFDFCVSRIEVYCSFCGIADWPTVVVSIRTETGKPVENVTVEVISSVHYAVALTNAFGSVFFQFYNHVKNIKFKPEKLDNLLDNIDEKDFEAIADHILGRKKITSPYKLIAADINNSKSITVADLIELRKVFLGLKSNFSNNNSWRFVPKNHTFPIPFTLQDGFPEFIILPEITMVVHYFEFIGIKIGDVI